MIDINVVKANGKYYSVKCDISLDKNADSLTARVIGLDLVELTSSTSIKKIKTFFRSETSKDFLSKIKYPYIYDAIIKKLIQKYKIKTLNI